MPCVLLTLAAVLVLPFRRNVRAKPHSAGTSAEGLPTRTPCGRSGCLPEVHLPACSSLWTRIWLRRLWTLIPALTRARAGLCVMLCRSPGRRAAVRGVADVLRTEQLLQSPEPGPFLLPQLRTAGARAGVVQHQQRASDAHSAAGQAGRGTDGAPGVWSTEPPHRHIGDAALLRGQ